MSHRLQPWYLSATITAWWPLRDEVVLSSDICRERLRDEQNKAFRVIRLITPPGPPNRRAEESSFPLELASLEISTRGQLPIITRGVMFGNLKPIPTDPYVGYCRNCGRRGVTLTTCPRCSERHLADIAKQYGKGKYESFRSERIAKVQETRGRKTVTLTSDSSSGATSSLPERGGTIEGRKRPSIIISEPSTSDGRSQRPNNVEVSKDKIRRVEVESENHTEEQKGKGTDKLNNNVIPKVDEVWNQLQNLPTFQPSRVVDLEPPTSSTTVSLIPLNFTSPPPALPRLEDHQQIPADVRPMSAGDQADRFVEQTRELAQALRGLPVEAIMLAMRKFFEERRRTNH
ncbi:uncharacterized protein LOC122513098 [Leptopilina heterotoma]|uniref:uncharacterized protein LOC122513098 n=1 Tax=Leptopilina heterotoma TaxID=63436 RepID=UPI001CA85D1C|nr:uncharacterized protein LOC122513098 [Leptopilina heterotoma]